MKLSEAQAEGERSEASAGGETPHNYRKTPFLEDSCYYMTGRQPPEGTRMLRRSGRVRGSHGDTEGIA